MLNMRQGKSFSFKNIKLGVDFRSERMNMEKNESKIYLIDITDVGIARNILDLQRVSYQIEANIIGTDEIPPLMETMDQLRSCGEAFLAFREMEEIVAALSYKREGLVVDIHRMMVHPQHFRKGIAGQLLTHLEELEADAQEFIVSTGAANAPAVRLYENQGFKKVREIVVGNDLLLAQFLKTRSL